jgi:nucleoside-diphosphate kinase
MSVDRTFAIIKPNAVAAGNTGAILQAIQDAGFTVRGMRLTRLTAAQCQGFYCEHVGKGFYPSLEEFMTESAAVVLCLEGENAVPRWRELMGATDPSKAAEGTLRKRFAESFTRNAVHGSDGPESAAREIAFFFSACDLV